MCMIEDAEGGGICLEDVHHVARAEHVCDDCQRTILPGEPYRRTRGIWEGEPCTTKMCQHCEAAALWLHKVCGGYLLGLILDDLREHREEMAHVEGNGLDLLVRWMEAKWRSARGELLGPSDVRMIAKFGAERVLAAANEAAKQRQETLV